jgi:hypothetical protein
MKTGCGLILFHRRGRRPRDRDSAAREPPREGRRDGRLAPATLWAARFQRKQALADWEAMLAKL